MEKDFTPEQAQLISEALAYQYRLDYEGAGPKAPHGPIVYKGVELSSRFDVKSEFSHMRRAIDLMPELMARRIESIWCDSRACAYYVVTARPAFFVDALPHEIKAAFRDVGGFNGLDIPCDGRKALSFDPCWPGDELSDELLDEAAPPHTGENFDDEIPF